MFNIESAKEIVAKSAMRLMVIDRLGPGGLRQKFEMMLPMVARAVEQGADQWEYTFIEEPWSNPERFGDAFMVLGFKVDYEVSTRNSTTKMIISGWY